MISYHFELELNILKEGITNILIDQCKKYWTKINFSDINTVYELNEILDLNNKHIDEDYISRVLDYLKDDERFPNLYYKFEDEDYWLDASESIWIRNLILSYGEIEMYKLDISDITNGYGFPMLLRVILYYKLCCDNIRRVKELVPISYLDNE